MMRLVSWLAVAALAFTALAGSSLAGAAAQAEAEQACAKLVITGHPSYPPVAWAAQGVIVGAAPALVSGIAARLGVKDVVSKDFGSWEGAQDAARKGEADVIFGIYRNDARAKYLDFIEPAFMADPVAIVVRKGETLAFAEWGDLKGRKGVTNAGESYGDVFDGFMAKNLTVARAAGVDQTFAALLAASGRLHDHRALSRPRRSQTAGSRRQDRLPAQGAVVVADVCRLLQEIQVRRVARGLCR